MWPGGRMLPPSALVAYFINIQQAASLITAWNCLFWHMNIGETATR
jgi:hypothetical protein